MPARPADLPENVGELWDVLVERFGEKWAPELEELVARYCRAVSLSRTAWRKVPKSLTARGSMGQPVAHPMIAVAQKADAEAARFGAMLGIDLSVKRGAGRPPGAVSAPDRKGAGPAKVTSLRAVKGGKAS